MTLVHPVLLCNLNLISYENLQAHLVSQTVETHLEVLSEVWRTELGEKELPEIVLVC